MTPDGTPIADPVAIKVVAALDRLARGRRAHRQRVATTHGVSPLAVDLLGTLGAGGPPEPLVGTLARELAVSQPTATDSARTLERKGLVGRVADPDDRRRTFLELTPAGAALVAQLAEHDRLLVDAVARLDPERQERVLEALLDLVAAFVEGGVIDVARTCTTCAFHVEVDGAHRCTLMGVELPASELRVNCSDHVGCRVDAIEGTRS